MEKIGAYDKQQWERTVEEKILRGLKHVPKRTGKLKTDLIDIDLVTGSTYPKAKPQNGNLSLILLGVCRALFLPCWWQWWQRHTSQYLLSLLVSTYFVQLAVMMLCFCGCFSDGWKVSIEGEDGHGITIAEILSPVIVMIVLSIVHTHIAATHSVTSHSSLSKSLGSVKKSSPNMKRPSNVSCKLYRTRRSTRSRRSASEEPELPSPRQKLEKRSHSLDGQVCMYHQSHRVTFQNPLDATAENNNDGTEETCGAASESQQTEWSNCRQDEYISSSSKSMYVIQEAERKLEEAVQPRALFEDTDAGISDAPVGQDDRRDSAMELNDSGVDSSWASAIEKRKSKNPNASHVEVRYSENGLSSGCEGEPLSEGEHGSEAKPLMNGFIGKSQSRFSGLKKTVRNGFESKRGSSRRRNLLRMDSSQQSSGDSEDQTSGQPSSLLQDSSPDVEWTAIDSYSSESPNMSDEDSTLETAEDPFNTSSLFHHTGIGTGTSHLVSNKVTVSCMIWEGGEVKKAGLSVLDISSAIISKVEHSADSMDYLFLGLSLSLTVSLLPLAYRAIALSGDSPVIEVLNQIQSLHTSVSNLPKSFVQSSYLELIIFLGGPLVRFVWAAQFFFLLAVAERTFKQRFLLSKLFCYLTSARRARQNDLPHFRLNKVRYEILNKKFRAAQKTLDREVSHVTMAATELDRSFICGETSPSNISQLIGGVVEKLSIMKRKCFHIHSENELSAKYGFCYRSCETFHSVLNHVPSHLMATQADESISEELDAARMCKRRVEHLLAAESPNEVLVNLWKKQRLDRMLVEYFLRCGYYETAKKLSKHSNIEDLTNIDVFLVSKEVEESLARRETCRCLSWCHDNKSRLRKLKSSLEFNLRRQEFIELIKSQKRLQAVLHARKYFTGLEDEHLIDIQQCMALLAFPTNTEISPYCELLSEDRWNHLIEQFRSENFKLYQLSSQSVFTVALQAGLSALKTPYPFLTDDSRLLRQKTFIRVDYFNRGFEPGSLGLAHISLPRFHPHTELLMDDLDSAPPIPSPRWR
ncbi:unnamed protein product, partial [Darwinula stevensoni]